MNFRNIFTTIFLLGNILHTGLQAQNLVVNTNQTATQLVNNLTGPGVVFSNANGTLLPSGTGTFVNNGVVGFTMAGGIILSTGDVSAFVDSTPSYHHSTALGAWGTSNDPLLDMIIAPYGTHDAQVLEFDFIASNDSVEFNLIFGSEEYNEYVNSFNDVFAFFVTGPGYSPNTNVALLPGTSIPIDVDNVNNGWAPVGTPATGPCMNCNYYVDNANTGAIGMCYDGLTTMIKIKFPVWPCSNYHFKIAIADAMDQVYDSALMLEEHSFVACQYLQPTHNGLPVGDTLTICAGGSITLTSPPSATYSWSTGDTTQSITITQPGSYQFFVTDLTTVPMCFAYSHSILVLQAGTIQTPVISQNNNFLEVPNLIPNPGITYQWNLDGLPILGATQSTLIIPVNGCYTLTIFEGTCESTSNEICITNTSIYEITANAINIYPNPVIGTSTIETPFETGSLSTLVLYDVSGREVHRITKQMGQSAFQFDRGELLSGIYFLEISNTHYQGNITRKIVLQ